MDKEHQTLFHIMLLSAFTVLCVLLDVVIVVSGWGNLAVVLVTLATVFCWVLHFTGAWSADKRLYIYIAIMLTALVYYGYHEAAITDIPILLCMLIVLLSRNNDRRLIYIVTLSYLVYLLENIFITHYINLHSEQIVFSRIALGIVCLLSSCIISVFFMRQYDDLARELKKTKELLGRAEKENELFLSNMSHELRTPINAVNGVSEILLARGLTKQEEQDVELIKSAGRRLYQQVSDVLDFSEIQTGHFALTMDEYEPISVVYDAIHTVYDRKNVSQFDFVIDVETTLPKTLYGDAERLKKLLVCLTDNALKFTDFGGAYLCVNGREESYGINLNIDIWDTGCGIPEEKLPHLFEGAFLGDSSSERGRSGLGLGLAIAHGIVLAMGGFLTIESRPSEGTHVHVSVPQQVRSSEPSIGLEHPEKYRVLCYFNRDKYVRAEIGTYYYQMVEHMRTGLGVDLSIASSLLELKELCSDGMVTHLFIAEWEYEMDPDFFEHMATDATVCVFSDHSFQTGEESRIDVIYKPVFMYTVVNHLRQTRPGVTPAGTSRDWRGKERKEYQGFRALVVDDEEMNLVVAKGILDSLGMDTEVCSSGSQAIERCKIVEYDIIFMDYMMPQMNGTRAMKRIREVHNEYYRNRPIIVFTANAVSGAKESFLKEGFDGFLAKPMEIKYLKKILDKYLTGGSR